MALVASVSALSFDLLLGGSYPYGGMTTKLERWATRCLRQIVRVQAHVQGGHNWIDSGAQAAAVLEETTTTMGSERQPP